MSRVVVFETPGPIDIRAFTCHGVNTKPNSDNPIGFFGTGLKYVVAVLARLGIPLLVVGDDEVWHFYRKKAQFRDKDFDFVRLKRDRVHGRSSYEELSYTTEYGKNWLLWQVFRELHSNTLDEGGRTFALKDLEELDRKPGHTYIVVTGEEFAEEFDQRDKTFLPDGLRVVNVSQGIQILDRPSDHLYYRGMRVYDLNKPSALTYNFLSGVNLTEDRTAGNYASMLTMIASKILSSEERLVVDKVVRAEGGTMEADLSFTYHSTEPSETFQRAVEQAPQPNATAKAYVRSKRLREAHAHPLRHHPRPWRWAAGRTELRDASDDVVFELRADMTDLAKTYLLELVNQDLDRWQMDNFMDEHDPEEGELRVGAPEVIYADDDVPF